MSSTCLRPRSDSLHYLCYVKQHASGLHWKSVRENRLTNFYPAIQTRLCKIWSEPARVWVSAGYFIEINRSQESPSLLWMTYSVITETNTKQHGHKGIGKPSNWAYLRWECCFFHMKKSKCHPNLTKSLECTRHFWNQEVYASLFLILMVQSYKRENYTSIYKSK